MTEAGDPPLTRELFGCVLAGGASTRMGQTKAFMEVGGETLLQRALDCLSATASTVCVVGLSGVPGSAVPCFPDLSRNLGPLGGIQTGLRIASSDPVLFCPCDCPLLPGAVYPLLLDRLGGSLAAIPVDSRGRLHPLIGIYRRDCLELVDERLAAGRRAVMGLIDDLQRQVSRVEVAGHGISDLAFLNVNTPDTLTEARRFLE